MRQHTAKLLDEAKTRAAQSCMQRANVMSLMTENCQRRPDKVDGMKPLPGKDGAIPDVKSKAGSSQGLETTMSGLSIASNESRRSSALSEEHKTAPVLDQKRVRNKHGLSLAFDDRCKAIK
jgi:hypothetical protein